MVKSERTAAQRRRDNVMGYGVVLAIIGIPLGILGLAWWPLVSILGVALLAFAYLQKA